MQRAVGLAAVLLLAGCLAGDGADDAMDPKSPAKPGARLLADLETLSAAPELRLETDHGTIRMVLYDEWLPQTTAHIARLAEDGFYDGTTFHRVVDDFVIQGGDRTGTGEGGSGPAGTPDPVPLEVREGLDFGSGAVGLARLTDDTGDSQAFITEKPQLHLSRPSGPQGDVFGAYALFGQVFAGMDVVRSIAAVETVPGADRPVEDVVVHEAMLLDPPADVDLLGLVVDVTPDFEAGYHVGTLEVPRHLVAGHPAAIRFTAEAEDPSTCRVAGDTPFIGGDVTHAPWRPVEADACTFETTAMFHDAGVYGIRATDVLREGTVHTVDVEVLPWHEAYGLPPGETP